MLSFEDGLIYLSELLSILSPFKFVRAADKPESDIEIGDNYCATTMTAAVSVKKEFWIGGITDSNNVLNYASTYTDCDTDGTSGFIYKYDSSGAI